ncbi:MAG: hypothetical protein DRP79_06230 [Planctomycetota bacterium]|nr:MAG: hypothetical protein DRP79_06230 [Planctomycetota bacterium]
MMSAQEKKKDVPAEPEGRQRVTFDDRDCKDAYANFFTVATTPEEVVVNFGVVNQERRNLVKLGSRVYLNYFNTKRLMVGLMQAIKQYEETYGAIEIDPKKRSKK